MRDYPNFPNVFRVGSTSSIQMVGQPITTPIISNLPLLSNHQIYMNNNTTNSSTSRNVNFNEFNNDNNNHHHHRMQHVDIISASNNNFQGSTNNLYRNNSFNGTINYNNNNNNNSKFTRPPPANNNNINRNHHSGSQGNDLNNSINSLNEILSPTTNTMTKILPQDRRKTARKSTTSKKCHESEEITSFNKENGKLLFSDGEKNGYFLWIMTPVAASLSLAIVIAALAGPQWLFTEEKLPNPLYNGTTTFRSNDNGAFITKYTKSSLWILCSAMQGVQSYNCSKIDYFPNEEYRADPIDSTLAIPYTITKSSPFFIASGIFLLISFIIFLIPTISHQNNLYYFSAGILFVVSGLIMLIGLIVYISIFKAEIGSKLRPKSSLQPPLFKFTYGQSFFLYVFGFITTEFVGVLNIFLYISLQQIGYNKHKDSCLPFMISDVTDDEENNRKNSNGFFCKKHLIPTNLFFENDLNRRYYLPKTDECNLHSKNLAKSLNELYTEPAPTFSVREYQQDFPLTRSVSTTTEIFSNNTNQNTLEKNNKKNQTNSGSKDNLQDICGLSSEISRGIRKTKDDLFNEFCKRAGVRPKPKNIYYIENDENECSGEKSVYIIDHYGKVAKSRRESFAASQSKQTSNMLFKGIQQQQDKIYPKSSFDLNRIEAEAWKNYSSQYFNASNSRIKLDDSNVYQTRTLPRCFLKRNFDSHESLCNPRLSFGSKETIMRSEQNLNKSCENISFIPTSSCPKKVPNTLEVQWPSAIPASPSNFSMRNVRINNAMESQQHIPVNRKISAESHRIGDGVPKKFQRGYAFDNRRSHGFDSFDLDKIERERRKSHASLFGENDISTCYDLINGTAV